MGESREVKETKEKVNTASTMFRQAVSASVAAGVASAADYVEHKLFLQKPAGRVYHVVDFEDVANFTDSKIEQPFTLTRKAPLAAPGGKAGAGAAAAGGATGGATATPGGGATSAGGAAGTQYGQQAWEEAIRQRRRVRVVSDEIALNMQDGSIYLGRERLSSSTVVGQSTRPSRFFVLQGSADNKGFNLIPVSKWYVCEKPRDVHRPTDEEIELRMTARTSRSDRLPFHTRVQEEQGSFRSMRVDGPSLEFGKGAKATVVKEEEGGEWADGAEGMDEEKKPRAKAYVSADIRHAGGVDGDEDMQEVDIDNVFTGDDAVMDSEDELDFGGA